jgi:hypothetical protein
MFRTFLLGAIITALAAPAFAQSQCAAPSAPAIPDGSRATAPQITAAQNEIKVFAAASDKFQECMSQEMSRQKTLASQNNAEPDPRVLSDLTARASAQREDVQKVATAWGATVDAFNKAQARKQPTSRGAATAGGGYGGGGYGGGAGSSRY